MKPYIYSHKYHNVIECKPVNTVSNKKATRQHAKKEIRKELISDVEFLDNFMLNISHLK